MPPRISIAGAAIPNSRKVMISTVTGYMGGVVLAAGEEGGLIMSIRNAAKAIILHSNKILLNKCYAPDIGDYFTLPGGGQNQYETMEEAVVRECLEETGYTVVPIAFVALYEEIYTHESVRQKYPDYAHRILHIFRCSPAKEAPVIPSEQDSGQVECVWLDLNDISAINLLPICMRENICHLIHAASPLYLGTHLIDFEKTV
jgi:8-oxo-dGTP pyrophosphatase MutT (NUDIX family)